jgi:adenylate cyclase
MISLLTIFIFLITSTLKQIKSKHGWLLELFNILIVFVFIYLIYLVAAFLFIEYKFVIAVVSPSIGIIFGYLGSAAYTFIIERKKNILIKNMFSQYVSGALVNQLLENPDKLRLGGERKELTILFSDVANFTSFSENKPPETVVSFMNDYLTVMTDIIINNQGTLDKYLGDAIMAFWGAPLPLINHAYIACESAVLMCRQLDKMREVQKSDDKSILDIRIGINTGDVVVGNMGGEKRFDYTVMGDNVNLASRLEGANKEYGTRMMISENTYLQVSDKFLCRTLDTIRVKGKTKPTRVFELIGFKDEKWAEEKMDKLEYFIKGLDEYGKGEFDKALKLFDSSIQNNPEDKPSWTYFERCQYYIDNPPDPDWDGVFEFKSK